MSRNNRLYLFAIVLLLLSSCKKTDHYAQMVNDQPYLITGEMGLYNLGLGLYPGYKTSYLVGDTATFIGKFFLDRPGSQIRVGNDTPQILSKVKIPAGINEYTHQQDQLDMIRFLITKSMGLGNNIHVSIRANGVTLQAPDISIRQFQGVLRRTDTTLYVDSITTWSPRDVGYYQSNYIPVLNYISVAGDGTICFNNLTGIYILKSGQVSPYLNVGGQLQENGNPFTVSRILGSVLSFGGDSLTFSAEVKEDTPDTATQYIFRICRMDLASRGVTTINRTAVLKGAGAVNEAPGPYEGAMGTLKIVATDLRADVNGAIYFINNYAPSRTDFDMTGTWYGNLTMGSNFGGYNQVYSNICRADAGGRVKSLFSQHSPFFGPPLYTIPGYPVAQTTDYLVSLDGSTGYAIDQLNLMTNSLGYFDLNQDALLISTGFNSSGYRFFSYDTSSVTGMHTTELDPVFYANNGLTLNNYLILPDGDLLQTGYQSLLAVDLQNKTDYCYAGAEAGMFAPVSGQFGTTGPAKRVMFPSSTMFLAGVDRSGAIYYMDTHYPYPGGQTVISFYKLYAKK
ncbi:MAG: hypothetical protein J0H74_03260 [Chitinophagaceae bacterium]|nr:hypothetical protein [Chitinophagaceae bacterium]